MLQCVLQCMLQCALQCVTVAGIKVLDGKQSASRGMSHVTLHDTATHSNTLHHAASHCITLQHTLTHCNTPSASIGMSHVISTHEPYVTATHCNALQHTATHCNTVIVLEWVMSHPLRSHMSLQHTATHCNTLQHTATHCNKTTHEQCQAYQMVFEIEWSGC